MTQVHSSGGAMAPFATPVSKGKAKAASQPDKKIAVPRNDGKPAAGSAGVKSGTQVTFGEEALHALEGTGAFLGKALLAGVEDVGEAAYYTVKTIGTGLVDVAKGMGSALSDGVHGVIEGVEDTATAVGHGVVHLENATGDVWSLATVGATDATNLATAVGTDATTLVTNVGTAATDVGIGAESLLSGLGSVARTAASYGTLVVKQTGKAISELT